MAGRAGRPPHPDTPERMRQTDRMYLLLREHVRAGDAALDDAAFIKAVGRRFLGLPEIPVAAKSPAKPPTPEPPTPAPGRLL